MTVTGVALSFLAVCSLTACGGASSGSGASVTDGQVSAVAAFYPLQYVVERVGADQVAVTNLTKPGAEPHDLELSPQDVGTLSEADFVVYLEGFQPAIDEAVAQSASGSVLEVSEVADVSLADADDEQQVDPHFWLDPMRLADVADSVASALGEVYPDAQSSFEDNAADLRSDLETLDQAYRDTLRTCKHRELVTSHAAFGYLADAYGLEQVGINGLTPESEPSPQDLAEVTDFVTEHDVTTIYYESLVSPDVAKTVADSTGASIELLDPIEGLSDASPGNDYLEIMRSNLTNLRMGLSCR